MRFPCMNEPEVLWRHLIFAHGSARQTESFHCGSDNSGLLVNKSNFGHLILAPVDFVTLVYSGNDLSNHEVKTF